MKVCTKCKEAKAASDYTRDRSKSDGLHSQCRACNYARNKQRRLDDPAFAEKDRAISKAWRLRHPERAKNAIRDATLKAKYGIGQDEYTRILSEQGGNCAICGRNGPGVSWGKNLHVDHDHKTGKVRGLLCQPCNTTLGKMNDDPALLRKAAAYVEQGGAPSNS